MLDFSVLQMSALFQDVSAPGQSVLNLSVLQMSVLFKDVSAPGQPVLPLNLSVLQITVLFLDGSVCPFTSSQVAPGVCPTAAFAARIGVSVYMSACFRKIIDRVSVQ